jgi:hypothetical protein
MILTLLATGPTSVHDSRFLKCRNYNNNYKLVLVKIVSGAGMSIIIIQVARLI